MEAFDNLPLILKLAIAIAIMGAYVGMGLFFIKKFGKARKVK